ncbi:hypothetical protein IQ215_13840 [Cyanobacterium stanieri LEGE 03274]|uniref:PIN domain-containing protein n=1 Tax=Cyanobacterium stanieri LEGE 03274 TaxID=1828756 RepID=A0ABR9V8A3_9CHRO|nr:hypothetical protein [Cyanobacterium stanieri]MBE9223779.1 hypothetical protein [Cyanobacterium stanieri LEGE 03274]
MLSPDVDILEQYDGIILDATALIDFVYLGDWQWLQSHYAPLYIAQEVLDSDQLELETREVAQKYLIPIPLDTEEMFRSFIDFGEEFPLLSMADRSTLAIASHRFLLCASDDGLVVEACKKYQIPYIRALRFLTAMVKTNYKTVAEVKRDAQKLINERGKHISPKIIRSWYQELSRL